MQRLLIAGRYRLLDMVGSGGMGRVWLARDEMLHRDVAVKEVQPPEWMTDDERDELQQRTLREARTAARLSHPNVVQIYDVVYEQESPWIVMEYVRSRSLHQVVQADGPLTPERVAVIGLKVLDALRAAHRAGVLHRDVKPHNVLIADDGRVVLTDFGLATFDGDAAVTRQGMVMGSPQYVAPERASDGTSSVETDLWSLGATLYAAVEGRSPFYRKTTLATLTALATSPPDPPTQAGPLRTVLAGLLRKDPKQRFTADEVDRLLHRVLDPTLKPRPRRLPRPRRPLGSGAWMGGGGSGGSAGSGGGAAVGLGPDGKPRGSSSAGAGGRGGGGSAAAGGDGPAVVRDPAWEHSTGFRRRGRRRAAVAGGAAVLVLLVAGTAWALNRPPDESTGGGPTPDATSTTAPGIGAAGGLPCPSIDDAITEPVLATPAPARAQYELMDFWSWYSDPSGYIIGVPENWRQFTDGDTACFVEARTERMMTVDPSGPVVADPVAFWRSEQARLSGRGSGGIVGYRAGRINEIKLWDGGAEWEYTYTGNGKAMKAVRLLVNADGNSYVISWTCPQQEWNSQQWGIARLSFVPAPA